VTKNLLPIEAIAAKLDLPNDLYEKRSPVSGKLNLQLLNDARFNRGGKMILVTATTPTVAGEGKTVTSIGLVQGLEAIGKRAILSSREPSLGPVFGMKGGAAGGGRSQVEPAAKINLHLHGDFHAKGLPVRASDLQATGPMMALLSDALLPNLVQTTEGTPATVHCGPFANIAHGTSSVISQQMGLRLADYVVNETGFASDLGFEKYMDLVSPSSGIKPSMAVLVTTVRSMKQQGEGDLHQPT
jgi:formyltetrahydrofolate synthetase